jgi:hypothetical protein
MNLKIIHILFFIIFVQISLVGVSFANSGEPLPRTILAIFDSQEGDDIRNTRIHRLAEMPLNHLGLVVKYHDIQKGMPSSEDLRGVRGVFTWFQSEKMPNPSKYIEWATETIDQGIRLVMFGNPGIFYDMKGQATPLPEINRLFGKLGLETDNFWKTITYDVSLIYKDPSMVEFERAFRDILSPFQRIWTREESTISYLTAGWDKDLKNSGDLIVIGPNGGYAAPGFAYFQNHEFQQWYINPFEYFRKAFATDDIPKPDTTTLSGQRIYYSHIDGDGWRNTSEIENYKVAEANSAEVIYKEVLKPFANLPVTVAPIAADLDPEWFGSEENQELARQIFSLPHVEAGSHTYSHPFFWKYYENYRPEKEWNSFVSKEHSGNTEVFDRYNSLIESLPNDSAERSRDDLKKPLKPLPEIYESPRAYNLFPFDLEKEITGSVQFINKLLPLGKKVEVFQWSGDCTPFLNALSKTQVTKLANINGGDTRFDREFPSHSWVAPLGVQVEDQLQVYASASNENTYTELWENRFFGFKHLVKTLRNTESPRRLKPINIYYHMYSGQKRSSLNALVENLNFIETLAIAPVTASRYTRIVQGFFSTQFILEGSKKWRVNNRGDLQTLRFDQSPDKSVDMDNSVGVIGQRVYRGNLYIFLDPAEESPVVALQDNKNHDGELISQRPYLVQGRWRFSNFKVSDEGQVSFNAQGFGEGKMVWKFPQAGDYELQLSDKNGVQQTLYETTDSEGILKAIFFPLAINSVRITIQKI